MTPFVIDASAVGALLLKEAHPRIECFAGALTSRGALAPILLFFEVRNLLIINERRGRIVASQTEAFLSLTANLPIRLTPLPDSGAVTALARERRLTVYDAAYLELAMRERLPLATLNRALEAAALAEGVELLGA